MTLFIADADAVFTITSVENTYAAMRPGAGLFVSEDGAELAHTQSGVFFAREAFLEWDLSSISADAKLVAAHLYVTSWPTSPDDAGGGLMQFRAYDWGDSHDANTWVPADDLAALPLFASTDAEEFFEPRPLAVVREEAFGETIQAAFGGTLRLVAAQTHLVEGTEPTGSNTVSEFAAIPIGGYFFGDTYTFLHIVYADEGEGREAVDADAGATLISSNASRDVVEAGGGSLTGPFAAQEQLGLFGGFGSFSAWVFFFEVEDPGRPVLAACFDLWLGTFFDDFSDHPDAIQVYAYDYGTLGTADWRTPAQFQALPLVAEIEVADWGGRFGPQAGTGMLIPNAGSALTTALNAGARKFAMVSRSFVGEEAISDPFFGNYSIDAEGTRAIYLQTLGPPNTDLQGVQAAPSGTVRVSDATLVPEAHPRLEMHIPRGTARLLQ